MSRQAIDGETPWASWVAREQCQTQFAHREPLLDLAATLARPGEEPSVGELVPPLAHWIYFHDPAVSGDIGNDGHARPGGFMPPIGAARRMWAASDVTFVRPFRVGVEATRRSIVKDMAVKHGASGELIFVTVEHVVTDEGGPVLTERQTIVYREPDPARSGDRTAERAPIRPAWTQRIMPDAVLLFRYSALTFNGHRIHYDHPYATEAEGYGGLVVHGPLIATLMLRACLRHFSDHAPVGFAFRAVRPLFAPNPFIVGGSPHDGVTAALFAADTDGNLCMRGTARFART